VKKKLRQNRKIISLGLYVVGTSLVAFGVGLGGSDWTDGLLAGGLLLMAYSVLVVLPTFVEAIM